MVNPLARVVMNNIKKKTNHSQNYGSKNRSQDKEGNLTTKEEDLVKGLISKDKKANNHRNKATTVSLDEAVEKIRDSQ